MRVSAILMAAGLSRRMGEDKLALLFQGKTLLQRAVDLLESVPFHQRLLVSTPERLAGLDLGPGVTPIPNLHPERGQSESLRLGVAAADGEGYLFFTADQPRMDRETVEWLLAHWDGRRIVYPTVAGAPRSPCLFPAALREELLALEGDEGGRRVRQAHPELCHPLATRRTLPFLDVDTPQDYRRLVDFSE